MLQMENFVLSYAFVGFYCIHIHIFFFIHLSFGRHLSCFCILTIVNNANNIGKDSDAGRDWGQEKKGTTEDEMAGWHHGLDGHESE